MMQEPMKMGPVYDGPRAMQSEQSLVVLLALVGTNRMNVEALREKIGLDPGTFRDLLGWFQREYLVDIVSALDGAKIVEKAELTEKGEAVLVNVLEQTCELPEFR